MKSMKLWIKGISIVSVLAVPLVLSGCNLLSKSTSEPIDPPQTEVLEDQNEPTSKLINESEGVPYAVYLQDRNGYLAPVTLPIALTENEELGKQLLEMMVDKGDYHAMLPTDFRAMIPQGTKVLSYEINPETSVAKVNFSEPFVNYNGADERTIVEAITWTLTSIEGIKGVEISVEGERLAEMPIAGYPLAVVQTRDMGINIEFAEGVSYTNSTPVTLYFSAETMNDEQYFVPVTRMVERTDSKAFLAMEELIQGPLNRKAMSSVILPDVQVTGLEEFDGVVHIDLQDDAYEPGQFVPSEMLEAVVLSLTENTGLSSVQIRVNGDINIFDENNNSYSAPVSKPARVNALKL